MSLRDLRAFSWILIDNYYLKHDECRSSQTMHVSNNFNKQLAEEVFHLALDMVNFRLFRDKEEKKKVKRINFLRVYFSSKDIEKVRINSIFRKHAEDIPLSFHNRDPPTILYLRSKTIGATIFNYKKIAHDVVTNNWKVDNGMMCDCSSSRFCDPHYGHVVTGNLQIIEHKKMRALFCKGPTYREPQNTNWDKFLINFEENLEVCVDKWVSSEKPMDKGDKLLAWKTNVLNDVKICVSRLRKTYRGKRRPILRSADVTSYLEDMQKKFVFVPTDKASNNIAVICKKFYIEQALKELGIFADSLSDNDIKTYELVDLDTTSIINRHVLFLKTALKATEIPETLPFLYWIVKMHKIPSKQRYIAASSCCSTKPLSEALTKCFKVIELQHRYICSQYNSTYGINPMWIIHNSFSVHKIITPLNRQGQCYNVKTYDFTTLYTSIPHEQLKARISWVVKMAFTSSKKKFISVYRRTARWTDTPKAKTLSLDCNSLIQLVWWLIENIFVTFGDKCFRQVIGIPMGTDCAPFLANLFLYSYEYEWIDKQRIQKKLGVLQLYKNCCRYIDDLFLLNNNNHMLKAMHDIYPKELVLVPDSFDGSSVPFLDLRINIDKQYISTSIFDKRDAFNFPIVNFPTLTGNIPIKSSYGVFTCEMVRYARACTHFADFEEKTLVLVKKLRSQYFIDTLLRHTWDKFYEAHFLLIQKYGSIILQFRNHFVI